MKHLFKLGFVLMVILLSVPLVQAAAPESNFSVDYTGGISPLVVNFTDTSTGSPIAWKWYDGNTLFNSTQTPLFVAFTTGTHQIKLNASNADGGTNSSITTITVTAPSFALPIANFTSDYTPGTAPVLVHFTSTSTSNILGYNWSFGDGSISTDNDPYNSYDANGTYTVSLTVVNASGYNTITKNITTNESGEPTPTPTPTSTPTPTPPPTAPNLLSNPSVFNGTEWVKYYTLYSMVNDTTAVTDPIGTNTADRVRFSAGVNEYYYFYQSIPVTAAHNYTISIYAQDYSSALNIIQLAGGATVFSGQSANFNVSSCTVTRDAVGTASATTDGSWCKLSLETTASASSTTPVIVVRAVNNNATEITGGRAYNASTSYMYFWEAYAGDTTIGSPTPTPTPVPTLPPGGTNRTWSGTYDFYPPNNIINRDISDLDVYVNSPNWIANLTQLSSRWPLLYGKTGYSQPLNTETFWVADPSIPLQRIVSGVDDWNDNDNVAPGVPIPSDMWLNGQAGDQPATILDFTHTTAYSLMHLSRSGGIWYGTVSAWNWSTNNNRFTNSTPGVPWFNNNWVDMNGNPHFYVIGNDGTINRTATTQMWAGRSMVDLPQWAMMPTYNEVMADDVDHALYLLVPYAGHYSTVLWPAINTGSSAGRENCIPGGARIRLNASYDISSFPIQSRTILQAAKTYGGIVGDNSQPAYGIQIYLPNDTRWTTADLDYMHNVPLSAWEVVDESSLMVNRYTMDTVGGGIAPTAHFYMNLTSSSAPVTYGSGTTYNGMTIGGNYLGASDFSPLYTSGVAAGGYDGSTVSTKTDLLKYMVGGATPATSGAVIYISPSANIDMGSTFMTAVPANVTIASNRGYGGTSQGGRIYSTAIGTGGWERPIFVTGGNNVTFTGLRLQGETYPVDYDIGGVSEEAKLRVGVRAIHSGFVMSNCNVTGFGYAGVTTLNAPDAVIKYNLFQLQQNRHESYGVDVQGGNATIIANVFNKNRHDVTASGIAGETYVVAYNRILDTGSWDVMGAAHIDAHGVGTDDSSTSEAYSGARYEVYQNSFLGGHVAAIHQRGLPSDGMYIHNNDILTDGALTGVTGNLPIYQTYQNIPGYGHMYVTNNRWKGTVYADKTGIMAYQHYSGSPWVVP